MKKSKLAIASIVALCVGTSAMSLVACGGGDDNNGNNAANGEKYTMHLNWSATGALTDYEAEKGDSPFKYGQGGGFFGPESWISNTGTKCKLDDDGAPIDSYFESTLEVTQVSTQYVSYVATAHWHLGTAQVATHDNDSEFIVTFEGYGVKIDGGYRIFAANYAEVVSMSPAFTESAEFEDYYVGINDEKVYYQYTNSTLQAAGYKTGWPNSNGYGGRLLNGLVEADWLVSGSTLTGWANVTDSTSLMGDIEYSSGCECNNGEEEEAVYLPAWSEAEDSGKTADQIGIKGNVVITWNRGLVSKYDCDDTYNFTDNTVSMYTVTADGKSQNPDVFKTEYKIVNHGTNTYIYVLYKGPNNESTTNANPNKFGTGEFVLEDKSNVYCVIQQTGPGKFEYLTSLQLSGAVQEPTEPEEVEMPKWDAITAVADSKKSVSDLGDVFAGNSFAIQILSDRNVYTDNITFSSTDKTGTITFGGSYEESTKVTYNFEYVVVFVSDTEWYVCMKITDTLDRDSINVFQAVSGGAAFIDNPGFGSPATGLIVLDAVRQGASSGYASSLAGLVTAIEDLTQN